MTLSWRRIIAFAAAIGCLSSTLALAQQKPAASSLDDELFKDLDDGAATKKPTPPKNDAKPKSDAEPKKPAGDVKPTDTSKPSAAKPAAPKPASKLTDPLDRELLDDLGGGDSAPDDKSSSKPNDDAHGGKSSSGKSSGGEASGGNDEGATSDDPLVRLSRRIRDAEDRLRRTDSGDRTQELQRGIVEDLEKLIAQIEKQKSQQKSSKSKGPPSGAKPGPKKPGPPKPGDTPGNEPAPNPSDSSDQLTAKKAAKPEAGKLKEMLEKVWGNLPERERQDVMQSSFEDFPAKYQFGIEQYFKTLLQRQD